MKNDYSAILNNGKNIDMTVVRKKHMLHHIPIDILVVFRAVLVQEKLEISLKKKLLILELNLYQYQIFLMDQCLLLIVNKQEKRKTKENC